MRILSVVHRLDSGCAFSELVSDRLKWPPKARTVLAVAPVNLAVADRDTWEKLQPAGPRNPPYFMPNSQARKSLAGNIEGVVILPARIEDFPGFGLMKVAPDLLAEAISFHEAGHIFAYAVGIESRNPFVHELIANFFMAGYIRGGHPEYAFMTSGMATRLGTQRYSSQPDLDYLYADGVGSANYAWFQFRLNDVAKFVLGEQNFATVIEKLKASFPAAATQPAHVDEILARLEKIRPGVTGVFSDLAGPSILPRVAPSACTETQSAGTDSILVVRNDTSAEFVAGTESGRTLRVAAGTFRKVYGKVGQRLTLAGGRCMKFGTDSALAVISTQ